jgi:hypothetical protein
MASIKDIEKSIQQLKYLIPRVENIEIQLSTKPSDLEESAKQSALNAIEHANQAESSFQKIQDFLRETEEKSSHFQQRYEQSQLQFNDIQTTFEKTQQTSQNLDIAAAEIKRIQDDSINVRERIASEESKVDELLTSLNEKMELLTQHLTNAEVIPETIHLITEYATKANSQLDQISQTLQHSLHRKAEIDKLYKRVFGEDIQLESGEIEHIDGQKDELEQTYKQLKASAQTIKSEVDSSLTNITQMYTETTDKLSHEFSNLYIDTAKQADTIKQQVLDLLPSAMAAGLSSAYENKKDTEAESLKDFETSFRFAILGLILVSLIPFSVDVYLLVKGNDLVQVIKDTPSLILSILPLYFPVLWLAYSTNKKLNLSKRLIEEYTHKSVLGKTFSGLSHQIESLPDHQQKVKEELRTRLLFNILQVSAENPGKLISNYDKADHPIMDALENSAKLSDAIEAISRIPGLSSLAKKLSEQSDKIIQTNAQRVENGLSVTGIDLTESSNTEPITKPK